MKLTASILLFISLSLQFFSLQGQESCQVLVPALQGSYKGDCKNGLAQGKGVAKGTDTYTGQFRKGYPNGKGTYLWSTGQVYEGSWSQGLREGEGSYTYQSNGRDTVIAGIWQKDKYIGPKPTPPKVLQKNGNITGVHFRRVGDGNQITVTITQSGTENTIWDFSMVGNNGIEYRNGNAVGFQNISVPFNCRISYTCMNPMKTMKYNCLLEFEITQSGNWELKIDNQ